MLLPLGSFKAETSSPGPQVDIDLHKVLRKLSRMPLWEMSEAKIFNELYTSWICLLYNCTHACSHLDHWFGYMRGDQATRPKGTIKII